MQYFLNINVLYSTRLACEAARFGIEERLHKIKVGKLY